MLFPNESTLLMNLVMKAVNKILAQGLNYMQFRELLQEARSKYSNLILHNVRWLFGGRIQRRFSVCLEEIKFFWLERVLSFPN